MITRLARVRIGCFWLVLALTGLPATAPAGQWSRQLEAGGEVSVDPVTRRATVTRDGVSTQLWDGVHKLQDGSTIIIHSGQMVPNEQLLNMPVTPQEPETETDEAALPRPIVGPSPCQMLVSRVCGESLACAGAEACSLSRQMLEREWQERRSSGNPGYTTRTSAQCVQSEQDQAWFKTCTGSR